MDLQIQKLNIHGVIDFINDDEVVNINDKYYKIKYPVKDIETLYSLPSNDKHAPYTKKDRIQITDKMKPVIFDHWSVFKKGDKVEGKLIKNIFNIDR